MPATGAAWEWAAHPCEWEASSASAWPCHYAAASACPCGAPSGGGTDTWPDALEEVFVGAVVVGAVDTAV